MHTNMLVYVQIGMFAYEVGDIALYVTFVTIYGVWAYKHDFVRACVFGVQYVQIGMFVLRSGRYTVALYVTFVTIFGVWA